VRAFLHDRADEGALDLVAYVLADLHELVLVQLESVACLVVVHRGVQLEPHGSERAEDDLALLGVDEAQVALVVTALAERVERGLDQRAAYFRDAGDRRWQRDDGLFSHSSPTDRIKFR
jgi:hypothetical protein